MSKEILEDLAAGRITEEEAERLLDASQAAMPTTLPEEPPPPARPKSKWPLVALLVGIVFVFVLPFLLFVLLS